MTVTKSNVTINEFGKICRMCLSLADLQTISEIPNSDFFAIVFVLNKCTQIKLDPDDNLPKQICCNCVRNLCSTYKFLNNCDLVNKALTECFTSKCYANSSNCNTKTVECALNDQICLTTAKSPVINEIKLEPQELTPLRDSATETLSIAFAAGGENLVIENMELDNLDSDKQENDNYSVSWSLDYVDNEDVKVSADSAILVRDTDTDNEENMATKIPPNVKSSEKFKGQGNSKPQDETAKTTSQMIQELTDASILSKMINNVPKWNQFQSNQKQLIQNQREIRKELDQHRTMLNMILNNLNKNNNASSIDVQLMNYFPLSSAEKLEELEALLAKEEVMEAFIQDKSSLFGCNGKNKGLNCCYKLIDVLFRRDFLTKYSWAGGSRSSDEKIAFKTYTNVMKLFFRIIRNADYTFTELACEKFLKSVIKRAATRASLLYNSTKRKRSSGARNRPNKSSFNSRVSIAINQLQHKRIKRENVGEDGQIQVDIINIDDENK